MASSYVFLFCFGLVISSVCANGEFSVLRSPPSLSFKGHDRVRESTLKEVYSVALGFSTEQFSSWQGMYISDPFNLADAIVTVVVDGVADIGLVKGHHFPMKTDSEESFIYRSLERRISERYPEQNTDLINIDLSQGLEDLQKYDIFYGIKSDKPKKKGSYVHLKNSIDEDREFLREINLLHAITAKVEEDTMKKDSVPDVYWFVFKSLHPLQDLYGENSTQIKEAKQLLNDALIRLSDAFKKIYNDRVLVSVITSDASHTRRSRSILETATAAPTDKSMAPKVQFHPKLELRSLLITSTDNPHNIAKNYDKNYPVIFNIILWFGVVMVFSLLAICIVIADMDPGRDSIIYRMTSTRMKKDN